VRAKASEYFMLRIPVSNGITFVCSSRDDRRNSASIRAQPCRYHGPAGHSASTGCRSKASPRSSSDWMPWGYHRVGACGDVVRNVTGLPNWRVWQRNEVLDASPIARAVARTLAGNDEFYNLPRKFKIFGHWLQFVVVLILRSTTSVLPRFVAARRVGFLPCGWVVGYPPNRTWLSVGCVRAA